MKFILFLLILLPSLGFCDDPVNSINTLISEDRIEEASQLLKKKLTRGPVLLNDVLLLGTLYEKMDLEKKAIQTYLFGIRKLHSNSWKQIKKYKHLLLALPELKPPSEEALLLAFKVGSSYYDLFLLSEASEKFNLRILETSLKYLTICEYFKFNLPKVKYYLGLVFKEYGDYKKSSISFLESWRLFDKNMRESKKRELKFKLMYGQSLVNYGHLGAGSSYLGDVYFDKTSNRYFKRYASDYLSEFIGSSVGGSLNFAVGNDSNVLLGNSDGTEEIKASSFTNKSVALFLSHAPSYSSEYDFSLSFSEELYTEEALKDNDSRSVSFSSTWDYKKLQMTKISLSYNFSKYYLRPSTTEEFDPESDTHQIILGWKRYFRKGILYISLPLTRTQYKRAIQSDSKALDIIYTSITFSKYWNPAYSFKIASQEEDEGFSDSKNTLSSFSNDFNFTDLLSGVIALSYETNSNSEDSLAYNERVIALEMYYMIEKINGLSIDLSVSSEANTPKSGPSETRLETKLGLSYFL